MNPLVAIVGPTAIGKSRLALRLGQEWDGEIVSADSRQVYRGLDIGTAKPARHELSLVPHHLVDIINPDEDFSLAQYQRLAYQAINDIQERHKMALLVGGSGLYVWAVLEGWEIPAVPPDSGFRSRLEERADRGEGDELYRELVAVDPVAAGLIDRRNVRRVIRALEVSRQTRATVSRIKTQKLVSPETLIIGLTAIRAEVYRRVDLRVDEMIKRGLVEEVRRLVKMGCDFNLPSMSGIGYRQVGAFLRGEIDLPTAIQQIKFETHRYVRQQYNWFRLGDKRIRWFDVTGDNVEAEITARVAEFLSR